jgi:hypothetical protein
MPPDPRLLIFFFIGLALLIGGLYWLTRERQFAAKGERAPGRIVSLEEKRHISDGRLRYYPVIRFKDTIGREFQFTSTVMSPYRNRWWVGQPMQVVYDPDNPSEAQIAGAYLYAGPAIVIAIGLGFALLGGGINMLKVLPGLINPASRDAGVFAGQWTNADEDTRDITRLEIGSSLTGVELKVWGKCHPRDCDWGSPVRVENVDTAKGSMQVWWDHRFARRNQKFALQADGRLQVVTQTHFVDRSNRKDYQSIEYFVRGDSK